MGTAHRVLHTDHIGALTKVLIKDAWPLGFPVTFTALHACMVALPCCCVPGEPASDLFQLGPFKPIQKLAHGNVL